MLKFDPGELLMMDGEYSLSIPKIAGFVVTTAIVVGIINNAEEDIGLWLQAH